jgi:hypothetical protein
MPTLTPIELKKALIGSGFEVYRTLPDRVVLAERVRDNLLMDGAVAACGSPSLSVRLTIRAQLSDFRGESPDQLFDRVRRHASGALERGFAEVDTVIVPMFDPGDKSRTLDTWYEVTFAREVGDLPALLAEVRYALALERVVPVGPRS